MRRKGGLFDLHFRSSGCRTDHRLAIIGLCFFLDDYADCGGRTRHRRAFLGIPRIGSLHVLRDYRAHCREK